MKSSTLRKNIAAITIILCFVLTVFTPIVSYAQSSGLVVCTGAIDSNNPNAYGGHVCDFDYFLQEIQHVINWMFIVAIPVAALLFAYGGVLYVIGTAAKRTQANNIFKATGIGFGIMLIAWAAVYTVVGWLVGSGSFVTGFLGQ